MGHECTRTVARLVRDLLVVWWHKSKGLLSRRPCRLGKPPSDAGHKLIRWTQARSQAGHRPGRHQVTVHTQLVELSPLAVADAT
jgi:hypothetical protein